MVGTLHIQRLRRTLAAKGRPMGLRRQTAINVSVTVTVQGILVRYAAQEEAGDVRQGEALVWITNDEIAASFWPGPPVARDTLVIDGLAWQLQGAVSLYDGTLLAGHTLRVRGG